METERKSIWKNELVQGIIIGCILTALGTCAGIKIQQRYETKNNNEEKLNEFIHTVNSVYRLGYNVTDASNSTVFPNRWESYVNDGYIPWLIKKDIYKKFITHNYPKLTDEFEMLENNFKTAHSLLIKIRQKQPQVPPYKAPNAVLDKYHKDIEPIYEQIKKRVQKINETGN